MNRLFQLLLTFVSLCLAASFTSAAIAPYNAINIQGQELAEQWVASQRPGYPAARPIADPTAPCGEDFASRAGEITWTDENWYGSYGAIASDVEVSVDGSRIAVGWDLNYEEIDYYDAEGDGTPLWTYDCRENSTYHIDGAVQVRMSADLQVIAGMVGSRYLASGGAPETAVMRFSPDDGAVLWTNILPMAPSGTVLERGFRMVMSRDGSRLAVAAVGTRQDPTFDPYHIYIYDPASSTPLTVLEVADPGPSPVLMYLNDMMITADGSRLVADFRHNSSPQHSFRVWDLTTYQQIQQTTLNRGGPQTTMGLSHDGGVMTVGDLNGWLQVMSWDDGTGQYVLAWEYHVQPSNSWVMATAVSGDGSTVAAGTMQFDGNPYQGKFYLFNFAGGATPVFTSTLAGDNIAAISISDDGAFAAACSYGPYNPPTDPGWDLQIVETATGEVMYELPGTTPGSQFDCAISGDGARIACGGKRVHARTMGSGGYAYSITHDGVEPGTPAPTRTPTITPTPTETLTPSPTPPPIPTRTPTPSPTDTPRPTDTPTAEPTFTPTLVPTNTPLPTEEPTIPPTATPTEEPEPTATPLPSTPTPVCDTFGVDLTIPAGYVSPGDVFWVQADICSPDEPLSQVPFFALLDISIGEYWFYPTWVHYPSEIAWKSIDLPQGISTEMVIDEFTWPETGNDAFMGIYIHAALLNAEMTEILGVWDSVNFGYGPPR